VAKLTQYLDAVYSAQVLQARSPRVNFSGLAR